MATIGNLAITYADWAKRMDDGYKVASIIEILSQTNEILDDMLVMEGNLPTGHKTTIRTGLPQATWRLLNAGVPNAKSTTAQIVDTCGNLETYAVIDKDIADLNGNTADFRLSEVRAFLVKYYGVDQAPELLEPLHTVTTRDRFGLVTVKGEPYAIVDIGLRMLSPRELYRAQGFPDTYQIATGADGRPLTKTAQVRMCGNSVCPPMARAIVAANYAEQTAGRMVA